MEMKQGVAALNWAAALDRLGGDETLLRELACLFLENRDAMMADVQSALQVGDAAKLELAAHSLKGSVATFGVGPLWPLTQTWAASTTCPFTRDRQPCNPIVAT